jgi:hypothetical protein
MTTRLQSTIRPKGRHNNGNIMLVLPLNELPNMARAIFGSYNPRLASSHLPSAIHFGHWAAATGRFP